MKLIVVLYAQNKHLWQPIRVIYELQSDLWKNGNIVQETIDGFDYDENLPSVWLEDYYFSILKYM